MTCSYNLVSEFFPADDLIFSSCRNWFSSLGAGEKGQPRSTEVIDRDLLQTFLLQTFLFKQIGRWCRIFSNANAVKFFLMIFPPQWHPLQATTTDKWVNLHFWHFDYSPVANTGSLHHTYNVNNQSQGMSRGRGYWYFFSRLQLAHKCKINGETLTLTFVCIRQNF